ncbi:ESX-4 secretion system protein EccC4 [Mycolicibacterium helvum]|uniref:ESX-4 secretion system protein EccC4 n=1 Tax=Mycolicibacterium helvum TaxID=1534349 RepID=A0A7I7T7B4_9MYCO|nr:ESX-4 secretion system protein EccC4 [Mycolicibacterium helvum]
MAPQFPINDLVIDTLPCPPSTGGVSRFVPLLGLGALMGIGALVWGSGMVARGPSALVFPAMMLVSAVGMAMHAGARRAGGSLDRQRKRYLAGLGRLSEQLCEAAQCQRASLLWTHPAPSTLWTLIGGPRMWERGQADSDFCHVRIGLGRQKLARRIVVPPVGPVDELDPVTADALRRFVHCHAIIDDAPIAVALGEMRVLHIGGDAQSVRALARAMLCQLAVLHSPDTLMIAAVVGPGRRQYWDWLKWLPHNVCPYRGGPMVYESVASVQPQRRHVVLIVDGADHRSLVRTGVIVVVLGNDTDDANALRLHVDGGQLAVRTGEHIEEFASADGVTMVQTQICARRLARHRTTGTGPDELQRWVSALAVKDLAPLRIALGTSADGDLVHLDIKEAADGGHGPHGLCIGATGSGKSELLRTIVVGMIARHSPDDLNLVLIDFKGGATFLGLEGLPHVAAVITNLADEAHLVSRAKEALGGEIQRRQTLLRRAGNVVNLGSYQRHRRADPTLPALSTLFIVVDEFAELLTHQPDFAELFTMIGRVGRSLGVHLLLASQRLDEGRLRGLESHLSYRVCLKIATAAESRAVLGVADAAELPATPGAAILRTGDGRLIRFQATYLGAPLRDHATTMPSNPAVRLFTSVPAAPPEIGHSISRTALDVIIDRFRVQGSRAHQVWLPPLTRSPHLSELDGAGGGELSAVIGLVDQPFEQRRAPLAVELDGAGGNVAVVGAPQSGKSNAVQTVITALAARLDPQRIQFYGLDFGGGTLEGLRRLPHVGSVATRREKELVQRIVSHVGAILSAREARCDADTYGDVFLVVDGWSTVREEFPDLEATITGLAARGLSFGIHVILTAGRWADIRPALKDQIGTRIELRLGDPIDSDVDRKQASAVPIGRPGRGITRDGQHFLIAKPDDVEVAHAGSRCAPPVRLLPALVEHSAVVDEAGDDTQRVLLGLGEDRLEPVALDFGRQQHLLILGDPDCGKTATVRALCGEIVRVATARPASLFVVDYRRGLLGLAESQQMLGYAFSPSSLADRLPELIALLQSRLPAGATSIEQLKTRSWWAGPEIFVVVDDYDVVSATSPDALGPLLALLPHATDIGLHLIVARRCAGSARAMFEPLLAHLRDSGCAGLLMSGSAEEGGLIGHHRAVARPPGRGMLVTRSAAQLVQVGWCAP